MPKCIENFSSTHNTEDSFASVYQAFCNLGWEVKYAGPTSIVGSTPGKWKTRGQQIVVDYSGGNYTAESTMMNNESFDLLGKNKKNVAAFIDAFKAAQNTLSPQQKEDNLTRIREITEATKVAAAEEKEEARKVNEVMHLEGSNLYVTYALIAINVVIFILMVIDGAGFMKPNALVHIRWGSNIAPLTLSGDYWRLLTNIFIHFGLIHLLANMYCLYIIGSYLEPMLGKKKYILAYFATGILASLTSLWWHTEMSNSAGASGAIFGLYGLFLALLTTPLIPTSVRKILLQNIALFVLFNLIYGIKDGVDNSAHIGGLISGFVIGYLYLINIQKEKVNERATWVMPVVIVATIGIAFGFLKTHKASSSDRRELLGYVQSSQFKDDEKFNSNYDSFIEMQTAAMAPLNDTTLTNVDRIQKIETSSIPAWEKAQQQVEAAGKMDVATTKKELAVTAIKYINQRKLEAVTMVEMLKGSKDAVQKFDSIENEINATLNFMNGNK